MSHDAPTALDLAAGLSGSHRWSLACIFQHPLSHNLSWREVLGLVATIGSAEHQSNGDVIVRLGKESFSMKPSQAKHLEATEVMDLRSLFLRAGWSPDGIDPTVRMTLGNPDLMIVVDQAGARLYQLGYEGDNARTEAPHEMQHLLHHIDRKEHDADREETYPADTAFFDSIATAATGNGRIVIIGQGKGQSNEADHLIAYLSDHRPAVHARVARELVADLPKKTAPQLAELARHVLYPGLDAGTGTA
jgi:hypothetical protein